MQSVAVDQQTFSGQEVQIWRHDFSIVSSTRTTYVSLNVAAQVTIGNTLDVCHNAIDNGMPAFRGSSNPGYHSHVISITGNDNFSLKDGNGAVIYSGCTFESADFNDNLAGGSRSGTLQCNGGFSAPCTKPTDSQSTNCGAGPFNGCDFATGQCFPWYQMVAYCRL